METSITCGSWKLTRKISQGERENVRAGLFQVLLIDSPQLQTQLVSCRIVANRLGHRLRIFLNHSRIIRLNQQDELQLSWINAVNDDLMLQDDLSFEEFLKIYRKVDIIVEAVGNKLTAAELEFGLFSLWKNTGGRGGFLGGKGAWLSEEEQVKMFPDPELDEKKLWKRFISRK